jgi:hypothetical protein
LLLLLLLRRQPTALQLLLLLLHLWTDARPRLLAKVPPVHNRRRCRPCRAAAAAATRGIAQHRVPGS